MSENKNIFFNDNYEARNWCRSLSANVFPQTVRIRCRMDECVSKNLWRSHRSAIFSWKRLVSKNGCLIWKKKITSCLMNEFINANSTYNTYLSIRLKGERRKLQIFSQLVIIWNFWFLIIVEARSINRFQIFDTNVSTYNLIKIVIYIFLFFLYRRCYNQYLISIIHNSKPWAVPIAWTLVENVS